MSDARRQIPAVDRLLASAAFEPILAHEPRGLVVLAVQQVQAELRTLLAAGGDAGSQTHDAAWYALRVSAALENIRRPSLRPVINATGVVLHTNLGRAPLADAALRAVQRTARDYSNLEFDLERGTRGSRYVHCAELLTRLTGAEAALVVNNNAAALVLALNTLARGRSAVISRGELVEIGGSFRVPEIMARAGVNMCEVGATNRTHLADYRDALGQDCALILKVHQSNFRIEGFTSDVSIAALEPVAKERGVPLLHDLGSGLLIASEDLGLPYEPTPMDSLRAGADIVTLSGDKLLGGPQAGLLLGRRDLIESMRANPLCRALRVDKLTLAALEATLALYLEPERARREIPTLRMLTLTEAELRERAERLTAALRAEDIPAEAVAADSAVGGGAFPALALPTWVVRIGDDGFSASRLEHRLRTGQPPVVARVADGRVLVDPRTVMAEEEEALLNAVRAAVA